MAIAGLVSLFHSGGSSHTEAEAEEAREISSSLDRSARTVSSLHSGGPGHLLNLDDEAEEARKIAASFDRSARAASGSMEKHDWDNNNILVMQTDDTPLWQVWVQVSQVFPLLWTTSG
jgi:hypothetical protein